LLHPIFVLMAWKLEHKTFPKWWEIICIFLHDVGIYGKNYLSDDEAKNGHWETGAYICSHIFLRLKRQTTLRFKAYRLCAGHCPEESGFPESKLSRADKRSRLVAPMWWTWWEYWVEFSSISSPEYVRRWRKAVAENLRREKPMGNHELYIRNRK